MTSRTPQFIRDDVADRLICIYLQRYRSFKDENYLYQKVLSKRNEIMSSVIHKIQGFLKKLQDKQDITYLVDFRMVDFAVFALKIAEDEMIKKQNEFTLRDDILYLILREFVKAPENRKKNFTSNELYRQFLLRAEGMGIGKVFETVYKNPK